MQTDRERLVDDVATRLTPQLDVMTPLGFREWIEAEAERCPEQAALLRSLAYDEVVRRAFAFQRREVERAVRFRPPKSLPEIRAAKDRYGIECAHAAEGIAVAAECEADREMTRPPGGWFAWPGLRRRVGRRLA